MPTKKVKLKKPTRAALAKLKAEMASNDVGKSENQSETSVTGEMASEQNSSNERHHSYPTRARTRTTAAIKAAAVGKTDNDLDDKQTETRAVRREGSRAPSNRQSEDNAQQ